MIGENKGYVGLDKGGIMKEGVEKNKNCVMLIEEIEKENKEMLKILLKVMDNGEMKENKGKKIEFRNVIIIMKKNEGE